MKSYTHAEDLGDNKQRSRSSRRHSCHFRPAVVMTLLLLISTTRRLSRGKCSGSGWRMNSPLLWDGACCELTTETSLLTQECCTSHQGLASCLSPLPHTAGSTWPCDPVSDTPLLMLRYVSPLFSRDRTMRLLHRAQRDRSAKVLSSAQPLSCTLAKAESGQRIRLILCTGECASE